MAEQTRAPTPSVTVVESEDEQVAQDVRTVRLTLRKPKTRKAVQWTTGTVDNEHLNRKKSKCCCQYTKPRAFDESSSSSSDEECEHCFGHVEKKKKKKKEDSQGDIPHEECEFHAPGSPDQSPKEDKDGDPSNPQNGGENF